MKKFKKPKQGLYLLKFPEKLKPPANGFMQSTKMIDGKLCVVYKSGLELKAFKYCDCNPKVKEWAVEPFDVPYVSPIDGKPHRYFPDIWIKFENDMIFIVEIKSSAETKPPKQSDKFYGKKMNTFLVNSAKWKSAEAFCKQKSAKFMILTEKVLND